jgi:hypothetical protein
MDCCDPGRKPARQRLQPIEILQWLILSSRPNRSVAAFDVTDNSYCGKHRDNDAEVI